MKGRSVLLQVKISEVLGSLAEHNARLQTERVNHEKDTDHNSWTQEGKATDY